MKGFARIGLAALCSVAVVSATFAQDSSAPATPEQQAQQAVETRQGLFKVMGWAFGPLAGMLRNRVPFDAAAAQESAARVEALSAMISDVFQTDTRKFQLKTKAREGIWANKSDFDAKAADLVKAAAALAAAAKTGEKGATLKAAGAVGKACGACHDSFRDK